MSESRLWLDDNDRYLAGEIALLRQRLERLAARDGLTAMAGATAAVRAETGPSPVVAPEDLPASQPAPQVRPGRRFLRWRQAGAEPPTGPPPLEPSEPDVTPPAGEDDAGAPIGEAGEAERPPMLMLLAQRFRLTDFERHMLLLCTAMELDTRIAGLCARAQGDPGRPYPTFALALTAFDHPAWDVLSPERPLRYWRLIEISQLAGQPLVTSAVKADERIVNYLKGLNYLDDRLAMLVTQEPIGHVPLSASQQAVADIITGELDVQPGGHRLSAIQLLGSDRQSKLAVARSAAARAGLLLYVLRADAVPAQAEDQEVFARLWHRESALLPISLFVETSDGGGEGLASQLAIIARMADRGLPVIFVDARQPWPELTGVSVALEVRKPTPAEQREAWAKALGSAAGDLPAQLAAQFDLSMAAIRRLAASVGDSVGLACGPRACGNPAPLWTTSRR